MRAKFVIAKSRNEKFFFNLKAANGEVILTSQMYESKAKALDGVSSTKANAWMDERYERKTASDHEHYFDLKAANHQVIERSEMYHSASALEEGISAVKKVAATALIEEHGI